MPDGTVLKINETIIEENVGNGNALFIHKTSIQHGDVSEEEETVNVGPVNNSNNSNDTSNNNNSNTENNNKEISSNNNVDKNKEAANKIDAEKSTTDKV